MNSSVSTHFRVLPGRAVPAALFAVLCCCSAGLAQTPSTDINTYVMFAYSELNFKGGNATNRGYINGGNVGVNALDPTPNNSDALASVGANGRFIMSENTHLVADSLRFGSEATAWDVFANYQVGAFGGTILNSGPTSFTAPLLSTLPTLPFTPGRTITETAADHTVIGGTSASLTPGNYRDIQVQNGGTLNLGTGVYNIRNFGTGQNTTINVTDTTILLIDGKFNIGDGGLFGGGTIGLAQVSAGSLGVTGLTEATINFGEGIEAHGQFFAPDGLLSLGRRTDLYGTFHADRIGSDFNVNVTYVPVPEPTTFALLGLGSLALVMIRKRR